jgi:hypothetical protein
MKEYKFEIIVKEGNDEFWEGLQGKTGCDEVLQGIESLLYNYGWNVIVKLKEYNDDGDNK